MKTVVLENATIMALAADAGAVARLPHLLEAVATLAPKPGCAACQKKVTAACGAVKRAAAAATPDDRDVLKSLLGADAVMVTYATQDGVATVTL